MKHRFYLLMIFNIVRFTHAMDQKYQLQEIIIDSSYQNRSEPFNIRPITIVVNDNANELKAPLDRIENKLSTIVSEQRDIKRRIGLCEQSIRRYTTVESLLSLSAVAALGMYITALPYIYPALYE